MKKKLVIIQSGAIILIFLDLITKWYASQQGVNIFYILPFFNFQYQQNSGIAFSLQVPYFLLIPANIMILSIIPFAAWKYLNLNKKIAQFACMLIVAGAIGNMYDRLTLGYVRDFIAIGPWPIFNLADAFLSIGIFLIIVFYGRMKRI